MDWEKLKLFRTVADEGSFTSAARRLGSSQSSLSRQIRNLENDLNAALFTRHARGLVLTQEGEKLYEAARDVAYRIETTEDALKDANTRPMGRFRVTTTVGFGSFWLTPHLKEFIRTYPDIELELLLSDEDLELETRVADVAIRFHQAEHADLIQRPLETIHYHIYASRQYLEQHGKPENAVDLAAHDMIIYGPSVPTPIKDINWILKAAGPKARKPVLKINNIMGVLNAVRAGMGLAALPDYLTAGEADLVRILPDLVGPEFKTYFVYPMILRRSRRIKAFHEFLRARTREAHQFL